MIDAVECAQQIVAKIMPTEIGLYTGIEHLYAVITEVDQYNIYADNLPIFTYTLVQVDIWQRGQRPEAQAKEAQKALQAEGYTRCRRGGDSEVVNGVTWHRISCDYEFAQEVD